MLQQLLSLFSICLHRKTTFPQGKPGHVRIVCLDCGKVIEYDWDEMRVVKRRWLRFGSRSGSRKLSLLQ